MWKLISAEGLRNMLEGRKPVTLIDLREPEDYFDGHIPGSVRMAEEKLPELFADRHDVPVVLICYRGPGSIRAARSLAERGFLAAALCGGMQAWQQAGYEVIRGR